MQTSALIDYFPLHNSFKEDIDAAWSGASFLGVFFNWLILAKTEKLLPIFLMASYFGEKIAMYFAWLTFYTSWLLYISIAGVVVSIFQLYEMSIDHYLIPLYCLLISLWITIMNQMWKRREAELAHMWNMTYFRTKGTERKAYQYEALVDKRTGEINKKPFIRTTRRMLVFSIPMIVFGLALIAAAFIGFRIWSGLSTSFQNSIMVGSLNGLSIFILNYVYTYLAYILTDLENHRYEDEWENSYIVKIFGFQFVNCYISLFAIAFYDEDLVDLAYTVGAMFVVKQFLAHVFQLIVPGFYDWWKMRCLDKKLAVDTTLTTDEDGRKRNIELEVNYLKGAAVDPIFDYCEMIIQIGYLTMFSSALPISPLFAFFRNLLEVRGNIYE